MSYQVDVTPVHPQTIAVIRLRAAVKDLSTVVPRACGEVWNYVRANGIPNPGRHVAVYLDDVMNIEVGVEVGQPFTGDGRVNCSATPAGLAATTAHFGPYHRLGDAYAAIANWCSANGHTFAGPTWEIYGHWTDDPTRLRTDVYRLLKTAAGPTS
jgi:effector-binding domain-containing protein